MHVNLLNRCINRLHHGRLYVKACMSRPVCQGYGSMCERKAPCV